MIITDRLAEMNRGIAPVHSSGNGQIDRDALQAIGVEFPPLKAIAAESKTHLTFGDLKERARNGGFSMSRQEAEQMLIPLHRLLIPDGIKTVIFDSANNATLLTHELKTA